MTRINATYLLGVLLLATAGFLCPVWYVGFVPLGLGALWASYDLIDDGEGERGDTSTAPPR
jgi:hypothetical protein